MATVETRCPHCHRQSQIRLVSRVAEGPYPLRATGKTRWGLAFQNATIAAGKAALSEYEADHKRLSQEMISAKVGTERISKMAALNALPRPPAEPVLAAFAGQCGFIDCGGPSLLVAIVLHGADELLTPGSEGWNSLHLQAFRGGAFEIAAIFPPSSSLEIHQEWPEVAKSHLPELAEDLARGREPSRILSGARTVLDVVLKDLLGKEMPKGRSAAIELLKTKGMATQSLADWAKQLWKDGSDASHDGIGARAQAGAYLDFLKVLLQIAYVLPAEIADLQKKDPLSDILG
jgi:hypothetical protein